MMRIRRTLAALVLLASVLVVNPPPASAHYDHWHQATCQGQWLLLYNWPSSWGGNRVNYWTSPTGSMPLDNPELTIYAQQGYECGWMGAMNGVWGQQVCEFGYCGSGIINHFA